MEYHFSFRVGVFTYTPKPNTLEAASIDEATQRALEVFHKDNIDSEPDLLILTWYDTDFRGKTIDLKTMDR